MKGRLRPPLFLCLRSVPEASVTVAWCAAHIFLTFMLHRETVQ
jgi:hypothetical protein